MNMVRNLAQAKAPQRLAPSQGMLAFSPAEIRPFLHHKSAGPHHRRGILRLSGRQRRNSAEVGPELASVFSLCEAVLVRFGKPIWFPKMDADASFPFLHSADAQSPVLL